MSHVPTVSVIIPNYNHAAFLTRRVATVLNQTFTDIEVIVLDDASTDNSRDVLAKLCDDPRVKTQFNDENSGNTFKQWNRGARLATGKYLWFAESDDWAELNFLERLVGMLEANPRCGMACSESWYAFGEEPPTTRTNQSHLVENTRWRSDYVADGRSACAEQLVLRNTMPNASAVVIRRDLFESVGGADETMRLCGDWMLWVKLLEMSDLAHIGDPLNFFRCSSGAVRKTHFSSASTHIEVYRIIRYIRDAIGVRPERMEEALAARAQQFEIAAWKPGFSTAQAMKVYLAARRIDPRARDRIAFRWLRMQFGRWRRRNRLQ